MAQPQMLNSFLKELGLDLGGGGGGNKKQKVRYDWRGRPIKPIPRNPYNASVPSAPGSPVGGRGWSGANEAARISGYLQKASDEGWLAAHGGPRWPGERGPTDKKKPTCPPGTALVTKSTSSRVLNESRSRRAARAGKEKPNCRPVFPKKKAPPQPKEPKIVITQERQRHVAPRGTFDNPKPLSAARSGTGV
jgi:hypothetical protein